MKTESHLNPDPKPDPPDQEESLSDTEGELQDFQGTDLSPAEERLDLSE